MDAYIAFTSSMGMVEILALILMTIKSSNHPPIAGMRSFTQSCNQQQLDSSFRLDHPDTAYNRWAVNLVI